MKPVLKRKPGDSSRSSARGLTIALALLTAISCGLTVRVGSAAQAGHGSAWDESLPTVELQGVSIEKRGLVEAWQEIATRYLVRSCLYRDVKSDSDSRPFTFKRESATAKDLMQALLAVYPEYSYTRDEKTGIVWFHRKAVAYKDILAEQVTVARREVQLPMYLGVVEPLCEYSGERLIPESPPSVAFFVTFNYCVDLPAGTFSVRDILNICCTADIGKAFAVIPAMQGYPAGSLAIIPINLRESNPLLPPRAAAVRFWDIELGKGTNAIPVPDDLRRALADPSPRRRWAARVYLEATMVNYRESDLLDNGDDANDVIWSALGLKTLERSGQPFLSRYERVTQVFSNDFAKLSPGVALLASMELAREKNDAGIMNRISEHSFSTTETDVIKPDLIRIARKSSLVREQLSKMSFADPELSPGGLHELERNADIRIMPRRLRLPSETRVN